MEQKNIALNWIIESTLDEEDSNVIKTKEWISKNPKILNKIVKLSKEKQEYFGENARLSIRDICAQVRWDTCVGIPNEITPALARIIEFICPKVHFKKCKSKCEKKEVI